MTPDATAPTKEPMVQRNVRVPLDLWDAAAAKGAQEQPPRGISDIVRDQLTSYVEAE